MMRDALEGRNEDAVQHELSRIGAKFGQPQTERTRRQRLCRWLSSRWQRIQFGGRPTDDDGPIHALLARLLAGWAPQAGEIDRGIEQIDALNSRWTDGGRAIEFQTIDHEHRISAPSSLQMQF